MEQGWRALLVVALAACGQSDGAAPGEPAAATATAPAEGQPAEIPPGVEPPEATPERAPDDLMQPRGDTAGETPPTTPGAEPAAGDPAAPAPEQVAAVEPPPPVEPAGPAAALPPAAATPVVALEPPDFRETVNARRLPGFPQVVDGVPWTKQGIEDGRFVVELPMVATFRARWTGRRIHYRFTEFHEQRSYTIDYAVYPEATAADLEARGFLADARREFLRREGARDVVPVDVPVGRLRIPGLGARYVAGLGEHEQFKDMVVLRVDRYVFWLAMGARGQPAPTQVFGHFTASFDVPDRGR